MTKTIFALGGGTFGEHRDTYKDWSLPLPAGQTHYPASTTPIDKLILEATNKPKPHVLLIMTASEDGYHDLDLLTDGFKAHYEHLGAHIDTLRLFTEKPSMEVIRQKIQNADVIYASGGSTYRMMRVWRRLGVDKLLREAYDRGTVMSGMSAGSICWFTYGCSDSFRDRMIRVTAMNWHKLFICPHFETEPHRQEAMKQMLRRTPGVTGVAIDEYAALEVKDDMYRIHAMKPGGRVQKCYWDGDQYILEELELGADYRPLTSLQKR